MSVGARPVLLAGARRVGDAAVVSESAAASARPSGLLTGHAWARVAARLAGWERGEAVLKVSAYIKAHPTGSHAVRVLVLPDGLRGELWGNDSNGDEVWAILRGGQCVTTMLRRSTQPRSRASLRVDYVALL